MIKIKKVSMTVKINFYMMSRLARLMNKYDEEQDILDYRQRLF